MRFLIILAALLATFLAATWYGSADASPLPDPSSVPISGPDSGASSAPVTALVFGPLPAQITSHV